MAYGQIG